MMHFSEWIYMIHFCIREICNICFILSNSFIVVQSQSLFSTRWLLWALCSFKQLQAFKHVHIIWLMFCTNASIHLIFLFRKKKKKLNEWKVQMQTNFNGLCKACMSILTRNDAISTWLAYEWQHFDTLFVRFIWLAISKGAHHIACTCMRLSSAITII